MDITRRSILLGAPAATAAAYVSFKGADDALGRHYTLQAGGRRLVVDPRKNGEPGDIVVVWPRGQGPMVARRLARCAPYNTFHFRALDTGAVFELACNKVSAIHAVMH